jgi:hypothetical protein
MPTPCSAYAAMIAAGRIHKEATLEIQRSIRPNAQIGGVSPAAQNRAQYFQGASPETEC